MSCLPAPLHRAWAIAINTCRNNAKVRFRFCLKNEREWERKEEVCERIKISLQLLLLLSFSIVIHFIASLSDILFFSFLMKSNGKNVEHEKSERITIFCLIRGGEEVHLRLPKKKKLFPSTTLDTWNFYRKTKPLRNWNIRESTCKKGAHRERVQRGGEVSREKLARSRGEKVLMPPYKNSQHIAPGGEWRSRKKSSIKSMRNGNVFFLFPHQTVCYLHISLANVYSCCYGGRPTRIYRFQVVVSSLFCQFWFCFIVVYLFSHTQTQHISLSSGKDDEIFNFSNSRPLRARERDPYANWNFQLKL